MLLGNNFWRHTATILCNIALSETDIFFCYIIHLSLFLYYVLTLFVWNSNVSNVRCKCWMMAPLQPERIKFWTMKPIVKSDALLKEVRYV